MRKKTLTLPGSRFSPVEYFDSPLLLLLLAVLVTSFLHPTVVASADNFTDVFFTNSFRGSFEWFKKLDWIGLIVQAVISVFSLVGVSLITIRIMTSLLYLSAKGLWEEVHDLKSAGGESELYDFGLVGMAKNWAKGKAGTGLDAILGAVLILLPDVKRYSDFGEKSGNKFDADINISQYMLKISLPTILAVFFLAMGFNGTLVKGLAVTVDAMGTIADRAVSVNYSGFIDDLVNSGTGYKFTFAASGTEKGKLQESIAKDIYGRVISKVSGENTSQLYQIGQNIENTVNSNFDNWVSNSTQISEAVTSGLAGDAADKYYSYLGYDCIVNTSQSASGAVADLELSSLVADTGLVSDNNTGTYYIHLFVKQTNSFDGSFFNVDEVAS